MVTHMKHLLESIWHIVSPAEMVAGPKDIGSSDGERVKIVTWDVAQAPRHGISKSLGWIRGIIKMLCMKGESNQHLRPSGWSWPT